MRGTVEAFDEDRGLGVVRAADGSAYPFHCTQIAGGSRTIATATEVDFEVSAGHLGRWEATSLRPFDAGRP
jgi:cold shock CspA family protein